MSFYADSFEFDGQSSEVFGLSIWGDTESSNGSGETLTIKEDYVYRRNKPFFYGSQITGKAVFPVRVYFKGRIDAYDSSIIGKWLFGHQTYKKIKIIQDDMQELNFNCIFTNWSEHKIAGEIVGYDATCTCDSAYAYSEEKILTLNFPSGASNYALSIYNDSHYNGYLFPTVEFIMGSTGNFSIINNTDNGREFLFTGISASETVVANGNLGTVVSDNALNNPIQDFNKNFLRLIPGTNNLVLDGEISQVIFRYRLLRKVGG